MVEHHYSARLRQDKHSRARGKALLSPSTRCTSRTSNLRSMRLIVTTTTTKTRRLYIQNSMQIWQLTKVQVNMTRYIPTLSSAWQLWGQWTGGCKLLKEDLPPQPICLSYSTFQTSKVFSWLMTIWTSWLGQGQNYKLWSFKLNSS
jgi:hypothetical protein